MQEDKSQDWLEIIGDKFITAVHFRDLLLTGRPVKLLHCTIVAAPPLPIIRRKKIESAEDRGKESFDDRRRTEWVNLESMTISEALHCDDCTFETRFEAKDARFKKTLTLRNCRFEKSLTLRGAEVGGIFDISGSTISAPELGDEFELWIDPSKRKAQTTELQEPRQENPYEPPPDWRSAKWNGLTVSGNLVAKRLIVHQSLNLGDAQVDGTLFLQGAAIGGGDPDEKDSRKDGRLYMRQVRVEGDVEMGVFLPEENLRLLKGHQGELGIRTTVHGSTAMGSSIIKGRLNIRGANLRGCLHAITIRVAGRVLADCWCHPDDIKGEHAIRTEVGVLAHGLGLDPQVPKDLSIYFQDSTIDSAVWLRGIETKGGINFENAVIGGALSLDVWHRAGDDGGEVKDREFLRVKEPMSKATLEAWSTFLDCQHQIEKRHHIFQTRVGKTDDGYSLNVRNARIAANLDLRGIHTKGRVLAHNTSVTGVLHCEPFLLGKSRRYVRTCVGADDDGKSLSLYGAKIGINVELSGAKFEGAVRMRYVTLEGGAVSAQRWDPAMAPKSDGVNEFPVTVIGMSDRGHGFYLYGAQIQGNVCCRGIEIEGCLSLELANVVGSVEFQECAIGHGLSATLGRKLPVAGVLLQRATISNDVDFGSRTLFSGVREICMGINATGVTIGGNLNIKECFFASKEATGGPMLEGEIQDRLKGTISLAGATVGGNLFADRVVVANEFNARGLTVKASVHLRNSRIGISYRKDKEIAERRPDTLAFNNAVIGQNLDLGGNFPHKRGGSRSTAVYGKANLSKITVNGKATISPRVAGKLQLDSSHIHNLRIVLDHRFPRVYAELDLEHATIEKLDFRGRLPAERRRSLKLEGLVFKHLDVKHFQGVEKAADEEKIGAGWIFLVLGYVGLFSFFWLGLCLVLGIPPLFCLYWLGLHCVLTIPLLPAWETVGLYSTGWGNELLWVIYSAVALFLCLVFFGRSIHIFQHFRSLGKRSALLKRLDYLIPLPRDLDRLGEREREQEERRISERKREFSLGHKTMDFVTHALPGARELVVKAHRKSTAWRCRILLAHTNKFSTAPHMAVRAMLEKQGEREHAADVYYGMRERELIEGSSNWMIKAFKWIFFVAAGSGVRVWPLVTFLIMYFMFSWLFVFSNPDSVEHPSTFVTGHADSDLALHAETARKLDALAGLFPWSGFTPLPSISFLHAEKQWRHRTGRPAGLTWQETEIDEVVKRARGEHGGHPAGKGHHPSGGSTAAADSGHHAPHGIGEPEWGYKDGFWMTVKIHVPLLHIWAKEKWEPAAVDGYYRSGFGMRKLPFGMEYETYAAIVQIISYLSIPMLISAIAGFYKGHEDEGGGEEHGHHHNHGP